MKDVSTATTDIPGDPHLQQQVEQLCKNLDSVVSEYAKLNDIHGQMLQHSHTLAQQIQHLRSEDIRLRTENVRLQEELRMCFVDISNLKQENERIQYIPALLNSSDLASFEADVIKRKYYF